MLFKRLYKDCDGHDGCYVRQRGPSTGLIRSIRMIPLFLLKMFVKNADCLKRCGFLEGSIYICSFYNVSCFSILCLYVVLVVYVCRVVLFIISCFGFYCCPCMFCFSFVILCFSCCFLMCVCVCVLFLFCSFFLVSGGFSP